MKSNNITYKLKAKINDYKYLKKVKVHLQKEEYQQAKDVLINHINNKQNDDYNYLLGVVYYYQQAYNLSLDSLQHVSESKINTVSRYQALCYQKLEQWECATQNWDCYKATNSELTDQDYCDYVYVCYKSNQKPVVPVTINIYELMTKYGHHQYAIKSLEDNKEIDEHKKYLRLANSYLKIFDYLQTIKYSNLALNIEESDEAYYLLAVGYNRQGNNQQALEAINKIKHFKADYNYIYLKGLILKQLELFDEAASHFYHSQPEDKLTTPNIIKLETYIKAEQAYSSGDYVRAEELYIDSMYQYQGHSQLLHLKIGNCLYHLNQYEQAANYYLQSRIDQGHQIHSTDKGGQYRRVVNFNQFSDNLQIDDQIVMYLSYTGANFFGSPLAIFNQLVLNPNLKHFIVLKDIKNIDSKLLNNDNVYVVKYNSTLHYRILASAKLLITNTSLPFAYSPRSEQQVLNTWHGTPLKHLGYDVKHASYLESRNVVNSLMTSTHISYPNQYTYDCFNSAYHLHNLTDSVSQVTGNPRDDLMLNITIEDKEKIRSLLNIDPTKKTVLYAPTYRDNVKGRKPFTTKPIEDLVANLANNEQINFIYKGHYIDKLETNNVNKIDPNQLLSVVDILITDYSSICIDFLPLNRPIILFPYDLEKYKQDRGLYIELEQITADICYTKEDVQECINGKLDNYQISENQQDASARFCTHSDGQATSRVLELLTNEPQPKGEKRKMLIYGGNILRINGIAKSFMNFFANIDQTKYQVDVVVTQGMFKEGLSEQNIEIILNSGANLIFDYGTRSKTEEEQAALDLLISEGQYLNEEHKRKCESVYKRNINRLFGRNQYDVAIDYGSGYATGVNKLFAFIECPKKILVLHSDMVEEQKIRFPKLKISFLTYDKFDQILSVSNSVNQVNMQNLGSKFNISNSKFGVLENLIDFDQIVTSAHLPLEVNSDEQYYGKFKTFVSIGRYSQEKNHVLAIKSFASRCKSDDKLLIIGSGPEEHRLQTLINDLGMESNVKLLGYRTNPYNYLKRSSGLLFPSLHEGQGLVILEALSLNIPYIAIDIPATSELHANYGGGIIAENTTQSYERAIAEISSSNYKYANKFVASIYNQNIIEYINNF